MKPHRATLRQRGLHPAKSIAGNALAGAVHDSGITVYRERAASRRARKHCGGGQPLFVRVKPSALPLRASRRIASSASSITLSDQNGKTSFQSARGEEDIGGPVYNEDVGVYERPAATDHERLSGYLYRL